jgi:hypothetical protein
MANPEREIKEMDALIEGLKEVSDALDGVIDSDMVRKLIAVGEEWDGYTKKCIEELAAEADA